jgi:DNA-binding transcriptional LysR family regulator
VLERLTTHRADVGIGGEPTVRDVAGEPFLENELIVVGRDVPDDLGSATWLLREPGSGTRAATQRLLAERRLEPTILTLGSNGAIKRALGIGLGVTLISQHAVARELREGELVRIPVKGNWFERRWHVLHARSVPERPAVAAFRAFLHSPAARTAIERSL